MIPAVQFRLTEFETTTALWQKLAAHYVPRLATLREKNDGELTPEETAQLRGQIREVKRLLELAQPAPAILTGD